MTCPACLAAQRELSHLFFAACPGCAARSVARGPNFAEARKTGRQDWKYRDELRLLKVTHDQVKAAHASDFINRRESATIEREA
jgi:hypothetical protein